MALALCRRNASTDEFLQALSGKPPGKTVRLSVNHDVVLSCVDHKLGANPGATNVLRPMDTTSESLRKMHRSWLGLRQKRYRVWFGARWNVACCHGFRDSYEERSFGPIEVVQAGSSSLVARN